MKPGRAWSLGVSGAKGDVWVGDPAWRGEFFLGLCSLTVETCICISMSCQRPTVLLYLTIPYTGSKWEEFTWIAVNRSLFIYLNKRVYELKTKKGKERKGSVRFGPTCLTRGRPGLMGSCPRPAPGTKVSPAGRGWGRGWQLAGFLGERCTS